MGCKVTCSLIISVKIKEFIFVPNFEVSFTSAALGFKIGMFYSIEETFNSDTIMFYND